MIETRVIEMGDGVVVRHVREDIDAVWLEWMMWSRSDDDEPRNGIEVDPVLMDVRTDPRAIISRGEDTRQEIVSACDISRDGH